MPMFKHGCIVLLLILGPACGGPTSAPTPTPTPSPLHGEVSDPVGDTLSDPRVPVPPDLVHATADVVAGNITFVIQFAPGTFDRQSTRAAVLLDTDQNASTGIRQADGLGADYGIDLTASTSTAGITKADPVGCAARLSCFTGVGQVPITFVVNGVQATVPLSLLGNADGRMFFSVNAYVFFPPPATSAVSDFMPDQNLSPGRVQ
jgi:hypothetical protein